MSQKKILVVDDDLRLRDLLTRYLSEQGFSVKAVGDSQQMDKARSREHYHLIVLEGRPGIVRKPRKNNLADCSERKNEARAGFHRPALLN